MNANQTPGKKNCFARRFFRFPVASVRNSMLWLKLACVALMGSLLVTSFAASAETPVFSGTVRLLGGDVFRGSFTRELDPDAPTSTPRETFRWACPSFSAPLEIPWTQLETLAFDRKGTAATGEESQRFVLEYWNGECVSGEIESIDHEQTVLLSNRFERQTIPTASIRTALRIVDVEKEAGLLAAESWQQTIPAASKDQSQRWSTKVGVIQTATSGAAIEQKVYVPDVNSMEIETAWTHSSPNWMLTLGTPRQLQLHLRKIEHRNALAITLLFEERENADIATAILPFEGMESIRLRILSDYIRGRFALQYQGKTIAEIRGKEKQRGGGAQSLVLTNIAAGGISLRELRISRSVFSIPANEMDDAVDKAIPATTNGLSQEVPPKVILLNSEDITGVPTDFRIEDQTFTFLGSAKTLGRVKLSSVERIEFPANQEEGAARRTREAATELYFVELQDGNRFSCSGIVQSKEALQLIGTAIEKPIDCKLEEVVSIYAQRWNATAASQELLDEPKLRMRLQTANAISLGTLIGGGEGEASGNRQGAPTVEEGSDLRSGNGGLFWKAESLASAVPLHPKIDGVIEVVRGAEKLEKVTTNKTNSVAAASIEQYGRLLATGEPSLYLASGDSIPARLVALDSGNLTVDCEYFGRVSVPTDQVRGFRYLAYTGVEGIEKSVLKRLLTVPRFARNNPATNLVISREGDILRGHLVAMDQDAIQIEVRGVQQTVLAKNVAEVIWMALPESQAEQDSNTVSPKEKPSDAPEYLEQGNRTEAPYCQAVLEFGANVGFHPQGLRDDAILGQHPLLGECELPLRNCVRLHFGSEIEASAKASRFAKWKLRYAIDPKFVQQAAESAAIAAGNSKWIGQQAPNVNLDRLDGTKFELASRQGSVVVLDFWASWCGPCRKSMPELAGVVAGFPVGDVDLVAINVEEPTQLARSAAATMGMQEIVALDRKGEIARAYEVQSLPYTVIIDRQGIIRGVFLGASPDVSNQIRESISAALESPKP